MFTLVLASQSPRRRELLDGAGFDFRVQSVKVSENIEQNLNPAVLASQLATDKARAGYADLKDSESRDFLVLGADTVVAYGDKNLGKPTTAAEAFEFLDLLSGRTHRVITGFCLIDGTTGREVVAHDETMVQFRELGAQEIRDYIATGEPMDKAGAYAIQGEGGKFVKAFSGSKSNVIGLCMEKLEEVLEREGWNVRRKKRFGKNGFGKNISGK